MLKIAVTLCSLPSSCLLTARPFTGAGKVSAFETQFPAQESAGKMTGWTSVLHSSIKAEL